MSESCTDPITIPTGAPEETPSNEEKPDFLDNSSNTTGPESVKSTHIRKPSKPKKLTLYDPEPPPDYQNGESQLEISEKPEEDVELEVPSVDSKDERRKSLRPRRKVKLTETVQDEKELDHLLNDAANLQAYGPAQHWNTGSGAYLSDTWISVEKILAHRRLAKRKLNTFLLEAQKSCPPAQRKMAAFEYFVKFHDQSYWHCAWMPGAILLALHPSLVRNYCRNAQVDITTVNPEDTLEDSKVSEKSEPVPDACTTTSAESVGSSNGQDTAPTEATVLASTCESETHSDSNKPNSPSLTITYSSQEESDEEEKLEPWSTENTENVQKWISPKPDNAGSRRRYLVKWGVESHRLIPERILAIGDEVAVSLRYPDDNDMQTIDLQDALISTEYREVLVKWFHVPQNQATWETVEMDMDMLDLIDSTQGSFGKCLLKDQSGRKLLPLVVRRHLIQLANAYSTRVAQMLCDAYGTHTTIGKRPPAKFHDWKTKWVNSQPDYLSPAHQAKLYPYQLEGVRWLWHSYHNHVNTILADEMGLGKTVQVIALLYSLWKERNDYGPFLIIAPLSTLLNWEREFQLWAPEFHVLVYSGDRNVRAAMQEYEFRIPNSGGVAAFHVMITSHELACIERSCLQGFEWSALIVDEAHRLKNKQSRLFKETSQYKATFKMLLTGTPLQNNLEELFHLLYFVEPKSIADFKTLTAQWADMPKNERIASLHNQLKNHLLRRLKADVIQDLPKKYEITVKVDLSVLQRKLYKLVLTKNYEELRCGSLMNSLVHLQKICDHPYLLPAGDAIAPRTGTTEEDRRYEPRALIHVSGKLTVLMEMLRKLHERGHRVLIYSRMTTMLDLLEEALTNEAFGFERIDGRVRGPVRQITVDRFNSPNSEAFVFLLSTRAGGEGINLASADTVILYDSDWNPQCDLQALSRAHRIGQSRPVVVYRFITRHTLEERIHLVARRKLALTELVVNQSQQRKAQKGLTTSSDSVTDSTELRTTEESEDKQTSDLVETPVCDVPGDTGLSQNLSNMPVNQVPVGPVSTRLSRSDMDDMLRCGLEVLFSTDDLLDESDLHKAACSSGMEDDTEKSEDSKRIVYDDAAIDRLLDRSNLTESVDQPKSAADEYLGTFRVAQFDTASPTVPTTATSESTTNTDVDSGVPPSAQPTGEPVDENAPQSVETLGYAAFWDKLLKDRYNRLCESEAQCVAGLPRRVSKVSWRVQHLWPDGSWDGDKDVSQVADIDETSESLIDRPQRTDRVDASKVDHASGTVTRRRVSGSARKNPPVSSTVSASKNRSHRAEKKVKSLDSDSNSAPASDEEQPANSDDDPSYIPSDEDLEEAILSSALVSKWQKRNRQAARDGVGQIVIDSDEDLPPVVDSADPEAIGNVDTERFCTAFWHPSLEVCTKWRQAVDQLGRKITWENECMFLYGFGPHDRQMFANAVMRHGLPPPGIVPPQDWLPPCLYSQFPQNVYAYTALFMQHLYEDPNALDDSKTTWSDGLPKENLCATAVLARIAMMALIRNKVIQFEDNNGVHSRTFEALSTRFKFSIHDGGLTMLRSTWHDEWRRINQMVESRTPQASSTTAKRQEAMNHLQRTWHSRHDYWLLAAIHVHGYLRWADILADPRFFLLNTGLEGVLEDMGLKGGGRLKNGQAVNVVQMNMAEAQSFLVSRLRLLEHALLVEQALFEVARAALTGNVDGTHPSLPRLQNLAVCLSNKLASAGPRKRIALPRDSRASEATRVAVNNLQDLLEDIYADLPGLPASIVCAESDPGSNQPSVSESVNDSSPEPVRQQTSPNPPEAALSPSDVQTSLVPDSEPNAPVTEQLETQSSPKSDPNHQVPANCSPTPKPSTDFIEISDGED